MLTFRGKNYYSAIEANKKFKISLSTVYYYLRRGEFKGHILDLRKFGEEKEIDTRELRAEFYIEERTLKEKARFLNYTLTEIYTKKEVS